MNELILERISIAIEKNYEIILEYSSNIDYNNQRITWDNQKYYIKNIKIDHISKEIKEYIIGKKKYFIKLSINNMSKNIEWFFLNLPWEMIDTDKINHD